MDAPTIDAFPTNQLAEGTTRLLTCNPSSSGDVNFTWYKNDHLIPNETSEELLLTNITRNKKGTYKCKTKNEVNEKTSESFHVDVYCELIFRIVLKFENKIEERFLNLYKYDKFKYCRISILIHRY